MTALSIPSRESVSQLGTLVEILRWRALHQPNRRAYTFLVDGETQEISLTYAELARRARAIAAALEGLGAPGQRALLVYPPGLEYICALFGCLLARVVAVPAYPPRSERGVARVKSIVADAQATFLLTTSRNKGLERVCEGLAGPCRIVATDAIDEAVSEDWCDPGVAAGTLAFLQYTSGSTATPRGVMLSHANLMHSQRMLQAAFAHTEQSVVVSWLPLYHDMGLIGGIFHPLYAGIPCILLSPIHFLERPVRWLNAISRYRATTSGGPNFAYDLLVRKIGTNERSNLDLSSWSAAFNGSEPVRATTLDRFADVFRPCGFRKEAFLPCYGLAEATLIVSGRKPDQAPVVRTFDSALLEQKLAAEVSAENRDARTLVGCGPTLPGQKIVVADPESGVPCSPGEIGEIWVAGPNVAVGYWNLPRETEETFNGRLSGSDEGPFLRTGDLGFLIDGELFVAGRLKDLIIIRGRNHYPQDIELTVERSHPALRAGCGAAFSVDVSGEEQLVVVQEVDRHLDNSSVRAVIDAIRQAVLNEHEVQVYAVALAKAGAVPKTTSGKIQRRACRARFEAGLLDAVATSVLDRSRGPTTHETMTPEAIRALGPDELRLRIEAYLCERVADFGGTSPALVEPQRSLSAFGFDSLKAIELRYALETSFGVAPSIAALLGGATLEELASHLADQVLEPRTPRLAPLAPGDPSIAEQPLSSGQQALWFMQQLAPESAAYNVCFALRITSELDTGALRRVFETLIERHPSLRTTYGLRDGSPVQRILQQGELDLEETDASSWTQRVLDERLAEEANRPFDVERGPLVRVRIFARHSRESILLVAAHHLAVDFWSLVVLADEIRIAYPAEKAGISALLPPLPLQYADYVRFERQLVASSDGERLWSYWRQQLHGSLPELSLPTDRPRPPVQTYRGASRGFTLSRDLTRRLRTLSEAHGATLYMTLVAAFHVLLHRYSGQTDLVTGSPTSGRASPALEGVVGYFVNPVVVRSELSGNPSFAQFLSKVRQTVLGAFEHQDLPFSVLVERLQPVRDPSRSPLVQVMFTFLKAHRRGVEDLAGSAIGETGTNIELAGLSVESVSVEQRASQFDISLTMAEGSRELIGSFTYSTDLFDPATIDRMAGHFQALLEGIVCDPLQRIGGLPVLASRERRQLLEEWNATKRPYPADRVIHSLFEDQVERTPDRMAVSFGEKYLTYRDLNSRANQLAQHLQGFGVGPETVVGICMERSLEMVVALVGVLKAGGAYLPLEPSYPTERLAFMLEDAKVAVLLSQDSLRALPAGNGARTIFVDAEWEEITKASDANPESGAAAENLAYVIYTSGSTGKPKGVMISHRALSNHMLWMQTQFPLTEADRVLQKTPFSFDASVWEFYAPLIAGARLVLARPGDHGDSAYLVRTISEERITILQVVPTLLRMLLDEAGLDGLDCLKRVFCGGEPIPVELAERFFGLLGADLHNLYGPSEATIDATFWTCRPGDTGRSVPIGRPVSNMRAYLLDGYLQPVPVGITGELYLAGAGLGRGYLDRAELTAESFVPDPFGEEPGGRMYRTGDLARFRLDGNIEFLGRVDGQVKVRGSRIELGEVEEALRKHPRVREGIVIAGEDEAGDKRLVAYVVADGVPGLTQAELRRFLKERLPEYMVPGSVVMLEALPLTPNGKVDRRSLPAPLRGTGEADAWMAPRTPAEEVLAGLWAEVLGLERVGVRDNFFELGGHSLVATRLMARIREALHVDLPLRSLFEAQTVAALAEIVEAARREGRAVEAPPLVRVPRTGRQPASYAQQRLWFLHQLDPASAAYNMPAAVRLTGPLDVEVLERSLGRVVERHEVLRTVFPAVDGVPMQVVRPTLEVPLQVVDLREVGEAAREQEAERLAVEAGRQPFDLERGPLVRAMVLRLGDAEHVLVLTMHHIVSDGWSFGIFMQEMGALYQGLQSGREVELPELAIQYVDYAAWQRRWLEGPALEGEVEYWKKTLAGAPGLVALPTDHPRPPLQVLRGARRSMVVGRDVVAALERVSRQQGASLFMTLVAALEMVLWKWARQTDLVIGTVTANRSRLETEKLIGCFMNFVPVRTTIDPAESGRGLVARVKEAVLDAYAHQECPFEKIVEAVNPERALGQNPIYNVGLLMQSFALPQRNGFGEGLTASFAPVEIGASLLDVRFVLVPDERAGLTVECEYNTDLFEAETIGDVLESYGGAIERLVLEAEAPVGSFELVEALEARAARARTREEPQTIAIAATFTAEPVAEAIGFWMKELDIPARVEFAPYNQVFQQLLDPGSVLRRNDTGVNVVLVRWEDWPEADRNAGDLCEALRAAAGRSAVPHVVCVCPRGQARAEDEALDDTLVAGLGGVNGVYVVPSRELAAAYPVASYYDRHGDELGRVPYTPMFYTALGTMVARWIHALESVARKVIVLDCDQTLWTGVCGEDGVDGVAIDQGRQALQEFMVRQHEAGRLLCLCSKNNEQDALEVFERRAMPLRKEHLVAWRINWRPKSENVRALAEELGLGLESFIFVDDDPVECAEVAEHCPGVLTVQLPAVTEGFGRFLDHVWAFDVLQVTEEDRQRTSLYRQNVEREQFRTGASSLGEFLAGLELRVEVRRLGTEDVARVSQLTQRVNQFTLNGVRLSVAEVQKVFGTGELDVLVVEAGDRFGEYGLVGAMTARPNADRIEVETFLLSCRALGRGVEHRMVAELGAIGNERGVSAVEFRYVETGKNQPALTFLQSLGAVTVAPDASGGVYRLPVERAVEFGVRERVLAALAAGIPGPSRRDRPGPIAARAGQWTSLLLSRIATELSECETLHAVITARQRRRAPERRTGVVAPRTAVEQRLAGIWSQVLGIDALDVHDNFFELGGHSLLAVRAVSRMRDAFLVDLSPRILFEAPTLESLARAVEHAAGNGAALRAPAIAKASREKHRMKRSPQGALVAPDRSEPAVEAP